MTETLSETPKDNSQRHRCQPPHGRGEGMAIHCSKKNSREEIYRPYHKCKKLISKKYIRARVVLWTDKININLCQSDKMAKIWMEKERKESAFDPNHTRSCPKHDGGKVRTCPCTAGSGTGSRVFTDNVTHDGSSKKNFEV